jgi:hypothetical protein
MNLELRLYLDLFESKSPRVSLAAVPARALYLIEGSLALQSGSGTDITLGANSAISAPHALEVGGGSLPARVLRWELVRESRVPESGASQSSSGSHSQFLRASTMTLDSPGGYLLRCDRVDFPPGGEALTHTHQGGGTRCLLFGSIRIDTVGTSHSYAPMGAWFEAGPDPVYAAADAQVSSAFARVMILPRALLGGKSSIHYVRPEDADKPKSQRYQIFVDTPIENL